MRDITRAPNFHAVHLGLASVVTTPVFPELAHKALACGDRRIAVCKEVPPLPSLAFFLGGKMSVDI